MARKKSPPKEKSHQPQPKATKQHAPIKELMEQAAALPEELRDYLGVDDSGLLMARRASRPTPLDHAILGVIQKSGHANRSSVLYSLGIDDISGNAFFKSIAYLKEVGAIEQIGKKSGAIYVFKKWNLPEVEDGRKTRWAEAS